MTKAKALPSVDTLNKLFEVSGAGLIWKERESKNFNVKYAGKPVGTLKRDGYISTRLNNKEYLVHRLVYKMHHGVDPEYIDHINRNRQDNRPGNLRSVTHAINNKNNGKRIDNTTGVTGVYWLADCLRWRAAITVDGVTLELGCFRDKIDAIYARHYASVDNGFLI